MIPIAIVAIFGLCFGSFVTAASWRLPKAQDLVFKPSHCPKCKKNLRAIDLIPVISYLILKGKCRQCRKKIGIRYPLTELATASLFVINYLKFGLGVDFIIFCILAIALMILIVSDLEEFIIPDSTTIVAVLTAISYRYYHDLSFVEGIVGAAMAGAIAMSLGWAFKKFLKKDALGFGDVKFMAAAGLWLGFWELSAYFILAGLIGVGLGLVWQYALKQEVFPFGPALATALYIMLLV